MRISLIITLSIGLITHAHLDSSSKLEIDRDLTRDRPTVQSAFAGPTVYQRFTRPGVITIRRHLSNSRICSNALSRTRHRSSQHHSPPSLTSSASSGRNESARCSCAPRVAKAAAFHPSVANADPLSISFSLSLSVSPLLPLFFSTTPSSTPLSQACSLFVFLSLLCSLRKSSPRSCPRNPYTRSAISVPIPIPALTFAILFLSLSLIFPFLRILHPSHPRFLFHVRSPFHLCMPPSVSSHQSPSFPSNRLDASLFRSSKSFLVFPRRPPGFHPTHRAHARYTLSRLT